MPESASVGSAVGRIRAHDLDAGNNAEVDYSIVPGDEGNMFDIISNHQSQEGVVVLKKVHSVTNTWTYFEISNSVVYMEIFFIK